MKKVTGQNIVDYFKALESKRIIQLIYKNETRRFNKKICMFSNTIYAVQNADSNVCSSIDGIMEHEGVFLLQMCDFELYQRVYQPAVLRIVDKLPNENKFAIREMEIGGQLIEIAEVLTT